MDLDRLKTFIASAWSAQALPALIDYMAIPCESPAFDPDWERAGHLDRAAAQLADWASEALSQIPLATVEVLRRPGLTPALLVDIPGTADAPVVIYGHLDKQPPMEGWLEGRSAWTPSREGDRLYGRGGADDGYAIFSAILAIQALRDQHLDHPRCLVLIEGCEESGSGDLPDYLIDLERRLPGAPCLIVALDAGAGDYDRLWATTSVRGQVAGVLSVRTLAEAVHSGDASGVAPSSLRVATRLLGRLEDPETGLIAPDFHVPIPPGRIAQAQAAAAHVDLSASIPLSGRTQPIHSDPTELLLNRAWRPQLTVTGLDGLPAVASAAAVMQPAIALKLGLRLPPSLDAIAAAGHLKTLLEAEAPYGAEVRFEATMISPGWDAPSLAPWLEQGVSDASQGFFGAGPVLFGGGGGIPFLSMLAERFPAAQFLVTGVLGPESNAHGPNEFLHLPTVDRITAALALILHRACDAEAGDAL